MPLETQGSFYVNVHFTYCNSIFAQLQKKIIRLCLYGEICELSRYR